MKYSLHSERHSVILALACVRIGTVPNPIMFQDTPVQLDNSQELSAIRGRIVEAFDTLSRKQQRLARYFLDHEEDIAFASASDVGKKNGVSAATVVRFGRALGYEGYTDLQNHIRATFSHYRTSSQRLAERISEGSFADNISAHVADVNIRNIQETLHQISPDTLNQAVDEIIAAERIRIFGGGLSTAAAMMAEYSLTMLGFPVRAIVNGGLSQTLEISTLTDRDTVILISIWRYLRDAVEVADYAQAVGATTIALTDSPVSPIARTANYVFIAATERAAHSRSLTGIISLIDLINATIVSKRPKQSMHALQRIDDLYHQQGKVLGD